MNKVKAMQMLVGVRERGRAALDEAVRAAIRSERDAQAATAAAQHALESAVAGEQQERAKLHSLTDPGQVFDVMTLTLREHVVEAKKAEVTQQQGQLQRCDAALAQQREQLRLERERRERNRQKIGSLQDRLRAWQAECQREQDDLQDEESEEAAIARMLRSPENDDRPEVAA